MARTPRVAIIGGGIAGLAAALALHRRGVEVTVYEQAGELSEIGAGVQMTPNAMNALRVLGLEESAMAVAFEPESQILRSWRSGRVIYRTPIRGVFRERFGAPLCSFHRADLLSVLAAPLPDRAVRLDARCVAIEPGEASAAAHFADGSTIEADIVVGADGIHSLVRTSLFGADSARFTGCMCWRGLVLVDFVELDGAARACGPLLCAARRDGELRRDSRHGSVDRGILDLRSRPRRIDGDVRALE
jgi:salicylate hydroxylase